MKHGYTTTLQRQRNSQNSGFLKVKTAKSSSKVMATANDNWSVLCVVIAPVERRHQEKTSLFEKENDTLPSRQCTGAHLQSFDGWNYSIKIRIITTSTVFTGFGARGLFSISKLEKKARRTTVHVEQGHRPNRCLFWGPSGILFFGWPKKVETIGKVYRVKRRLCWKRKKSTQNYLFFYLFLRIYWTILVISKAVENI